MSSHEVQNQKSDGDDNGKAPDLLIIFNSKGAMGWNGPGEDTPANREYAKKTVGNMGSGAKVVRYVPVEVLHEHE